MQIGKLFQIVERYKNAFHAIPLKTNAIDFGVISDISTAQYILMKTTNPLPKILMFLLSVGAAIFSNQLLAQNEIINPGFQNGTTGWSTGCSIEINPENVYGGTSTSNMVTEIDIERCFNQQVAVVAGNKYDFSFKASRRTGGGTPAAVGVNVTITGVQSGIQYLNVNRTYANTVWNYTTESFSFTLPLTAVDTKVNISFSNYQTTGTYGTLVDDVDFHTDAIILPIRLMSFTGQLVKNAATLSWTASNDDNDGRYFIVERASNGGSFDSIGIVPAGSGISYSFTDTKMLSGANNYRLKIVSRASSVYSKIINLDNAISQGVQVYPNPATSTIGFTFTSTVKSEINVTIYSLSGSMATAKMVQLNAGINTVNIDITSLRAGTFFMKISDGATINYVQAFCKK